MSLNMDEQMNNPVRQEPETPTPEVKPEAGKVSPKSAPPKKELTPAQLQRRYSSLFSAGPCG